MLMKIPLEVCAVYTIFSLGLTAIFVAEFWGNWNFNILVPIAFACGITSAHLDVELGSGLITSSRRWRPGRGRQGNCWPADHTVWRFGGSP